MVAPRPAKPRFAADDCVGGGGGRDSKDLGCLLLDPLLGRSLELNNRLQGTVRWEEGEGRPQSIPQDKREVALILYGFKNASFIFLKRERRTQE